MLAILMRLSEKVSGSLIRYFGTFMLRCKILIQTALIVINGGRFAHIYRCFYVLLPAQGTAGATKRLSSVSIWPKRSLC